MGRHFKGLTNFQPAHFIGRACANNHRPFKTDESVGNGRVIMPGNLFARLQRQYLHAQVICLCDHLTAIDMIRQVFGPGHVRVAFRITVIFSCVMSAIVYAMPPIP